jgi:hypothetical protein
VKGLFMDKSFNSWNIKALITLATPHSPAVLTDHLLARYYDRVNNYWKENGASIRTNTTVINILMPRCLSVDSCSFLWVLDRFWRDSIFVFSC